jgi:hypothetical protein
MPGLIVTHKREPSGIDLFAKCSSNCACNSGEMGNMLNLLFLYNQTESIIYRTVYFMVAISLSREYLFFLMS